MPNNKHKSKTRPNRCQWWRPIDYSTKKSDVDTHWFNTPNGLYIRRFALPHLIAVVSTQKTNNKFVYTINNTLTKKYYIQHERTLEDAKNQANRYLTEEMK